MVVSVSCHVPLGPSVDLSPHKLCICKWQVTPSYLVLHGGGGHDDPAEDEAGGRQRDQREGRGLLVIIALDVGSASVRAMHASNLPQIKPPSPHFLSCDDLQCRGRW